MIKILTIILTVVLLLFIIIVFVIAIRSTIEYLNFDNDITDDY